MGNGISYRSPDPGSRARRQAQGQRRSCRSALSVFAIGLLAVAQAAGAAVELPGQTTATLSWSPASGPVAGYFVYESRDGGAFSTSPTAAASANAAQIIVSGAYGETVQIRVAAFGVAGEVGPMSPPSEVVRFVAPPAAGGGGLTNPSAGGLATVFVGSGDASSAVIQAFRLDGSLAGVVSYQQQTAPPFISIASLGDVRAAACDLDGDGDPEYVLGFGPGSKGWLQVRGSAATGLVAVQWIHVTRLSYVPVNGETRPACGDIDGDGRDEIVVGLGTGGGGYVHVFDDELAGFVELPGLAIGWPTYSLANGETNPALGDIDGDGRDEIVVGMGAGSQGWMMVFDDFTTGYARVPTSFGAGWLPMYWLEYAQLGGATHPSLGDIDGDGRDEIVVGLAGGGDGWLRVYDHDLGYFATPTGSGWIETTWPWYNALDGSSHPKVVDLDGDGEAEVLVALSGRGQGRLQILTGASGGFAPDQQLSASSWLQHKPWALSPRGPVLTTH